MHDLPTLAARGRRHAALIGFVYAVAGTLWILLSDSLVASISTDPGWLGMAQHYKGLAYVALTTVLLVWLISAGNRRLLAAARALANSELQVDDLFWRHPRPMWVYDEDSLRFLRVNDAAVAEYGYSRDEFLAMTIRDIRPADELPQLQAALDRARTEERIQAVFQHRRRSGQVIAARVTSHRVELAGARARMVMAEDITEELAARDAMERQDALFRQLHQSLGEVLWLSRADEHRLLYVSPAVAEVYGRDAEAFLANPGLGLDCVHPDDRALAAAQAAALRAQGATRATYRIVRPDGTVRWIEERRKLIHDPEGRLMLVGGIAEDITARKERDEAREALKTQLERLVAERTAELERTNVELEAFTHTAAHDLRSPLNAIAGLAYVLRSRHGPQLGEDGMAKAARIERSAHEMAQLINDLLGLSRISHAPLQRETVDLVPMVHAILRDLAEDAPRRGMHLQLPAHLPVQADRGLLRSLLHNLLGNAWKYSAEREVCALQLSAQPAADGLLQVSLRDNGAGFDASLASPQFQPFQRFHAQARFQGTGLGLVTCQRIVQRHGGRIWLESTPGVGTTVHFTLPDPGAVPPPALPTDTRADGPATTAPGDGAGARAALSPPR